MHLTHGAGQHHAHARAGHWLDAERLRVYPAAAFISYAAILIIWYVRYSILRNPDLTPIALDFMPFWSAAHMAVHGHAVDAYNIKLLTHVEIGAVPYFKGVHGIMPWLYPPTLLLFILPLGLLPYWAAYNVFAIATLIPFVLVLKQIAPWREARLPIIAFPGIVLVLVVGQAALLTGTLAGLSLLLLKKRPALAGVCAGLLFVKPHLALLFPLAFICCRSWRALIACAVTVLVTVALSAAVFGVDTYIAFLHNADMVRSVVEIKAGRLYRMPTVFAAARMLHIPIMVAYAVHAVVALGAVIVVIDAWRKPCAYALRAAALLTATFLISSYLYDYDMAWFGLVIAWMTGYSMRHGWLPGERELFVLLWITPLLGLAGVSWIGFQFMPLITIATLTYIRQRIVRERVQDSRTIAVRRLKDILQEIAR